MFLGRTGDDCLIIRIFRSSFELTKVSSKTQPGLEVGWYGPGGVNLGPDRKNPTL